MSKAYDITGFRHSKIKVKETYVKEGLIGISTFCSLTMIPLFACLIYLYEDYPDDQDIIDKINMLLKFYNYDTIVETKDGVRAEVYKR
jgi:hypothetical protein